MSNLSLGFSLALSLQNVFFCFGGAVLGTVIGVLPGIRPVVGISPLLPMNATSAVIMLAGIYYGAAVYFTLVKLLNVMLPAGLLG